MTGRDKIVITGCGTVNAAGLSVDDCWQAVCDGRSALAPVEQWDTTGWPPTLAGEIRGVRPRDLVPERKTHKFIRHTDMLGIHAAGSAIDAAGWPGYRDTLDEAAATAFSESTGIYVGSGGGNFLNQYDYLPLMAEADGDLGAFGRELDSCVNPMWLLRSLPNNVLCHVGIRHGLKGANACITNHCTGSLLAIVEAAEGIRTGEARRAVAVGHEAPVEPQALLYYQQLGLMSPDRVRPFDRDRNGSIFGDGAGAVVLEAEGGARERGAAILGEVLGSGSTSDAAGLLEIRADGDGLARAISLALDDAGIAPRDVGLIVTHGNGTPQSDGSEARAIRSVFGDDIPPATAFKWCFGHLLSAAAIVETALALKALHEHRVPGIPTLESLDPACRGLPVGREQQSPRSDIGLILSRGFAGTNGALLIRAAAR